MAPSNHTSRTSATRKSGRRPPSPIPHRPQLPTLSLDDFSVPGPSAHIQKHRAFSDDASSIYTELSRPYKPPLPHHQPRPSLPPPPSSHRQDPSYHASADWDPSMNINIITVSFNLSYPLPLGIYIEIRKRHPCNGIYISKITPNSLAARDRRIRPGMLVLKVNHYPLELFHPEKAIAFFQEAANPRNTRIKLTCVECNDGGRFSDCTDTVALFNGTKLTELSGAVKPKLNAITEDATVSATSTFTAKHKADSSTHSYQSIKRFQPNQQKVITVAMAHTSNGLPQRHIIAGRNCFSSDELIVWLKHNVDGFDKEKQVEKFAAELVKEGLITQVVDKALFTKMAYFTFTDKVKALKSDRVTMALATGKTPMMDDTLPQASYQSKGFVSRIKKLLCSHPQHASTEWPAEEPRGSSHHRRQKRKESRFSLSMPQFQRSLSISTNRTHAFVSDSSGSNSLIEVDDILSVLSDLRD